MLFGCIFTYSAQSFLVLYLFLISILRQQAVHTPASLFTSATCDSDPQLPDSVEEWDACFERHYQIFLCMFKAFADAGLTVKPSKCFLFMRQVKYVSHILRNGKRRPDRAKRNAVANWKHEDIKMSKALKGFLGLVNWYSIYIHKYADHAAPIMEALSGKYQSEPISPDKTGTLDGPGSP